MVTRVRRFSPGPHLCPARSAYSTRTTATPEAVDADGPVDAQTRPPVLAKPRGRGFAQAPTASVFFLIKRPERKNPTSAIQISTFLRGQRQPKPCAKVAGSTPRKNTAAGLALVCSAQASVPAFRSVFRTPRTSRRGARTSACDRHATRNQTQPRSDQRASQGQEGERRFGGFSRRVSRRSCCMRTPMTAA